MTGTAPRNYGVEALLNFAERMAGLTTMELSFKYSAEAQEAIERFLRYYQAPSDANGWRCPTCGTPTKQDGYANSATRTLAQLLGNDDYFYNLCRELVEQAGSVTAGADRLKDYLDGTSSASYIDEALSIWTQTDPRTGKMRRLSFNDLPFADVFRDALASVAWREIADDFKPESWGDADTAPVSPETRETEDGDWVSVVDEMDAVEQNAQRLRAILSSGQTAQAIHETGNPATSWRARVYPFTVGGGYNLVVYRYPSGDISREQQYTRLDALVLALKWVGDWAAVEETTKE